MNRCGIVKHRSQVCRATLSCAVSWRCGIGIINLGPATAATSSHPPHTWSKQGRHQCRLQAGVTRPNRSDSPRCPRGPRQFYQRMCQFCQSGSYIYSGLKFTLQVDTFSRDNFVSSEIISWLFSHEDSWNPSPYLFDNCLMICCHGWYQVLNTVSSGLEQGMGCTNYLTECDCFSLKHNNAIPRWPTNLSDQHQAWQHQHPV